MVLRNSKIFLNIIVTFVLMLCLVHTVFANQYETSNILVSVDNSPYSEPGRLESVAVSSTGWFTLSLSSGTNHYVNLYNSNCEFHKRLNLHDSGEIYLYFSDTTGYLIIFPVRQKSLIEMDMSGSIIRTIPCEHMSDMLELTDPLRGFTYHIRGKTYQYTGMQLTRLHAKVFTVFDDDGNILYQYSQPAQYNWMWLAVWSGVIGILAMVSRKIIKKKHLGSH